MGKLFLSHRLELLAEHLAAEMARDGYPPLTSRIILVPASSMKQWLLLRCADLSEARGIAGCKIFTLREGLGYLLPASSGFTEIFCAIFAALPACLDPSLCEYLKGSSRRQVELAYQLALLFQRYGQQGQIFRSDPDHWQIKLFHQLFIDGKLRLPMQTIPSRPVGPIHCFGFDFLPQSIWQFFSSLPSVFAYLFSPCSYYWEDVCTDRERIRLGRYWGRKGAPIEKREELDLYLREAPPFLANWGKLGRENLKILDQFDWEIVEDYRPDEGERDSRLGRLQRRLLDFELEKDPSPDTAIFIPKRETDLLISPIGSSRFKEIEHLRRSILRLMETENLPSSEIAVLAPDIQDYASLIECIFSDLPYRIAGAGNLQRSFFYQGMHRLFELGSGDWEAEDLLSLFENPFFCRARKWDAQMQDMFREWLSHQKRGEFYEERMLEQSVYFSSDATIGSFEQIEQWIDTLRSLRADTALLRTSRTLADWAALLQRLVEKYLAPTLSEEADAAGWNFFQQSMKEMAQAHENENLFPFAVPQKLLQHSGSGGQIHASHLHAIRFASLEEGALTPARALFLIGMDEESYPRRSNASSIDLLGPQAKCYIPTPADRDRYLFLQVLFTAREFLQISYRHLTPDEGKPLHPSFLVEELRRSLNLSLPEEQASAAAAAISDYSFPWPEKPAESLPEGEFVIPLSELVSLSRHPWRFYLQKKWGIYLEDRGEATFSLQRAKGLRESLHQPIEEILKEEMTPGICGDCLKTELIEAAGAWRSRMESWGAAPESLSFRLKRQTKKRTEDGWECPPIEFTFGDRLRVQLTGEVKTFSSKGFLHAGDDSVEGMLKIWPEYLAAAIALDRKEIHFLKNGKVKAVDKPEEALKAFLTYYFLSLSAPSPLLPDWATTIFRKGPEEWEKKILDRIGGKGVRFEDPVFDWVLAKVKLPSAESWRRHWETALNETFPSLLALYPTRGNHASL